jgi:ATP-dependent DNA helicase PIF1
MIPTNVSVEFKRLQFPVRLTFVITIKKAQGHRYKRGLNFENTCFLHGQLYMACSRVGKASDLFVCTPEEKTKNIVFSKALQ